MHHLRTLIIPLMTLLLLSGCTGGRSAFSKAEKLERDGNLDAALVKYAEVAAANPDVGEYRVRYLRVTEAAARAHYKKGEAFYAAKNYSDALREYQSAYAIDPTQTQAKQQADAVQRMINARTYYQQGEDFEKNRKPREALDAYRQALEFQPDFPEAKAGVDRIVKTRHPKLDGFELNLKSTKPITLKFKDAKLKEIFNILSQLSGINFIFDDAVKDVNISLFLENATFQQAMEIITGMNKLGRKVLNESTIILYPRTPEKAKQYEELFLQTFYLNKLDAKKAVNLIRTMLQVKKIYVNEEMNALVIRDTPEVIEVARKILEANDVPDAEVLLDVEVFELSKSDAENFGVALSRYATSLGVTPPGSGGTNPFFADTLSQTTTTTTGTTTTTSAAGPSNLLHLFNYRNFNGYLTVPTATFNFGKTVSNAETLSNPKIRVKNREKAKFNVGTRVPITTTSSPTGGGVTVNVQYVDVGVKVNAEPTIQLNNDVSIKLGLEVSSILQRDTVGTDQATTVVTIGTRNLDTVLSLKDGETSIIGGLIERDKSDSKNKVSFLGDIPVIGALFTNTNDTATKKELMLAITPRIVRAVTVPEGEVAAFWSGREDDPSTNKPYASFSQDADLNAAPAATGTGVPQTAVPGTSRSRRHEADALTLAPGVTTPAKATTVLPTPVTPAATAPATPAGAPLTAAPVPQPVQPAPQPVLPAAQAAPAANAAAVPVPAPPTPAGAMAPAAPVPAVQQSAKAAAPAVATPVPTPVPQAQAKPQPQPQAGAAKAAAKPVAALPAATVALSVDFPASVKTNEQFVVKVTQSGAKDLNDAAFALTYDPVRLELVTQVEGTFMTQGGAKTTFQAFPDRKKGELWMALSRVDAATGASGTGTLAAVTFRALTPGAAPIGVANPTFKSRSGSKLEVVPYNSVVEVK
ncbi:secretin N-terminal domain-containing protein [Geomesophilobacter sediminis]|uniref:Type II secretion system protein n=1 Tax=Geomesophilobacter sediminis TaxID=2798584 RepID=A0A8J7ISM9_9BACT|nr:secretin N-terminal domain-containing protein [Geomesophilobacter sediminis]MBJ6726334.1 type II secretion system protein [Geomesophilobacter sediminis]